MKCEKCGNDYPLQYYFATPTICKDCFSRLPVEEQQMHFGAMASHYELNPYYTRIGFGRRLGAALLDFIIFYILFIIVLFISGTYEDIKELVPQITMMDMSAIEELSELITPIALLLTFIYYSLEIFIAATPGKMILNIQIGSDDQTKAPLSKLLVRFMVKHGDTVLNLITLLIVVQFLDVISFLIWLAIFIGFFFTLAPKRQALHDIIAKTAVYYRQDLN